MRILLSLGLLGGLLTSVAIFSWIYRRRLSILFGITPKDDLEAQESARSGRDAGVEEIRVNVEQGSKSAKKPLDRLGGSGNSTLGGQTVGHSLSSGSSSGAAAPMIVVAGNDANRGAHLPYDVLEKACGNWAESRRIGSGGAAIVYRAELPRYGSVAVKRFHNKEGSSKEWSRELDALIQCRHPSILEIIGHADEGPENLIVMPLMEGGTLCESLQKMQWSTRVVDVAQVVRALSFLHGKGILHRDVKSSNILLDGSLRHARLADFGLAKDQVARQCKTSHGTTGVVMGSPGYMAPELMMRPANEKTDAFALGVVLLELLTGLPAWDVDENGSVLTDRAVVDGVVVESLLDPSGQWPRLEIDSCSLQAVALTLFDPRARKTLAAVEQDAQYVAHLERATAADLLLQQRSGAPGAVGALS